MAWETAQTFSPSIKNGAGSGATGLIQFMDATAKGLGTTIENLELLSAESQLYYVKKYFEPYAKRIKTRSDMYMAIFYPKYIGLPEDTVISSGGAVYRQNAGFDLNRDGKITKAECTACIDKMHKMGMAVGCVRNL
ncbi:MAG TPA: hypothetical protein VN039_05690 [Nitrospira sp.]|nr:hypothetical protein [Nitrospira sp.]